MLRFELLSHPKTQACNYRSKNTIGKEKVLATKIHWVTHASEIEIRQVLSDSGIRNDQLEMSHGGCVDNCDICASSGCPQYEQRISISHVNQASNEKI